MSVAAAVTTMTSRCMPRALPRPRAPDLSPISARAHRDVSRLDPVGRASIRLAATMSRGSGWLRPLRPGARGRDRYGIGAKLPAMADDDLSADVLRHAQNAREAAKAREEEEHVRAIRLRHEQLATTSGRRRVAALVDSLTRAIRNTASLVGTPFGPSPFVETGLRYPGPDASAWPRYVRETSRMPDDEHTDDWLLYQWGTSQLNEEGLAFERHFLGRGFSVERYDRGSSGPWIRWQRVLVRW